MPTYTIRDPQTGRSVKLTGDSPPTEQELTEIFAQLGPAKAQTFQEQTSAGTQRLGQGMMDTAGVVGDVVTGAAKSVGRTVLGMADIANTGMKAIGLDPSQYGAFDPEPVMERGREMMAPTNTAQKVGGFIGDTAQMVVPAGRVAKMLPATRTVAGQVVKGTPLIGRMGAQAGTGAAVTAAQTGGDPEDIITSALLMGAAPAVASAASSIGKGLTERLPERLYTQVFKAAHDDVAQALRTEARGVAPNPTLAREAVERGIMGSTRNMAVYSVKKLDTLEAQLQQEAKKLILNLPKKTKYIELLDDIEQRFGSGFFGERAQEAATLKAALTAMPGPSARATDMLKIKRFLDGLRTSSSFRLDQNLAAKQEELKVAADLVRATLHKRPTLSPLIQEERIFINAFEALVDDAVRTNNRKLLSLTDVLLGGGGMASGIPGAGLGTMALVRAGQTPRVLTGMGQALYRTGRAIPSGTAVGTTQAVAAGGAVGAR